MESQHGGVLILVKNGLNSKEILTIEGIDNIFECAVVKLSIINGIYIICVYRAPSSDFNVFVSYLENCMRTVLNKGKDCRIILCGDLNVNFLATSSDKNRLLDLMNSYCIYSSFIEPTRITKSSISAIDYVFTNFFESIIHKAILHNGISDHSAQKIVFPVSLTQHNQRTKTRCFSNKNINIFRAYLMSETWTEVFSSTSDTDRKFSSFINIFNYYYEQSFTFKFQETKRKTWLTRGIKVSSNKLKTLFSMCREGVISEDYYNKYKATYSKALRCAKRIDANNKVMNARNKSKTVWNLINNSLGNKYNKQNNITLSIENSLVTDNRIIADHFNNFFSSITSTSSTNYNCTNPIKMKDVPSTSNSMVLFSVDETEVFKVCSALKNSNSCGADGISSYVVKSVADLIAAPLCNVINKSFNSGHFPNLLKLSKIICLFKKGDRNDCGNYRPIALLSVFSKVFEKLLAKRIIKFCETYNILSKNQFGFQKNKSTTLALANILNFIYKELDNHHIPVALFLDLSKAFDSVDHDLLLFKLDLLGIRGTSNDLIRSYLKNRQQYVHVNGCNSYTKAVNTGVPQGSILGPLLFILYVNDINLYLNCNHCAFADDISIIASGTTEQGTLINLTNDLTNINNYFLFNNMQLNQNKTYIMSFHSKAKNHNKSYLLRLNNRSIVQTEKFKLLGLTIDLSLTWNDHVDSLYKKICSYCFALKRLHQICNSRIGKVFYNSHFVSNVRYGIIFWGSTRHLTRIFILQKRALRCMYHLPYRSSCKQIFINEELLTIPCIYIFELLKFVRTNISSFTLLNEHHEYNTRTGLNLQYDKHNLQLYRCNPYYMGAVLFNHVPFSLKTLTATKFANSVKSILSKNAFYSVEDYLRFEF